MTYSIVETLALVDRIRSIAFDRTLDDGDARRRIRDLLTEYREGGAT